MGAQGGYRVIPGFGRHLSTRTSATAGQDGVRAACARRAALLVVDLLDPCPWSLIHDCNLRKASDARRPRVK